VTDGAGAATPHADDPGGVGQRRSVLTAPGLQTVAEDGVLAFNAANGNLISFTDIDAGSTLLTLSFQAEHGTVYYDGQSIALGVEIRGTAAALNILLSKLTFRPDADFTGDATVTVTVNDQGIRLAAR